MDDQAAQVLIAVGKQLAIMVGIFWILLSIIVVYFKRAATNAVFCEFIEFGQSTFELLKVRHGREVETSHGVYTLPDTFPMEAEWPHGVPSWLSETVRHVKYQKGRELPLVLPAMGDVEITASVTLQRDKANEAVLSAAAKELAQASKEDQGLRGQGPIILATGIILVVLIGGGKLAMDKLDVIAAAVGG